MAGQQFHNPQSGSHYDREQDDFGVDPLHPNRGSSRGADVSNNAQNTVNDIDSVLGDYNNSRTPSADSSGIQSPSGLGRPGTGQPDFIAPPSSPGGTYDRPGNSPGTGTGITPSIPGTGGGDKKGGVGVGALKAAEGIGKENEGAGGAAKEAAGLATAAATGRSFKAVYKLLAGTRKKKGLLGGGLVAMLLAAMIAGLLMIMPLKVVAMATNLQNMFFSSSEDAANRFDDNLIKHYLIKKVVPGMVKGKCTTTRRAKSCADVSDGGNIVTQMYRAWRDANLEGKLADQYGIELRREGTHFYLRTPQLNSDLDLGSYDGNTRKFEDKAFAQLGRSDVRTALRSSFKDMTLSKGMMYRYTVGKLAERKYGIRRCLLACTTRDKFQDNIDLKKKAFKLYFNERVVAPYSEGMALAVECGMNGFNCSDLEASDDNGDKLTEYQQDLKTRLTEYRLQNDGPGKNSLADIDKDAEDIQTKGFTEYLIKKLAGETVAKVATKAIPVAGWIMLGIQAESSAATAGPAIQNMDYVINSTAAAQTFAMFRVAIDESHTGNIDPDEYGSLTASLGQDPTADQGGAAAEQSPLYQEMFTSKETNPPLLSALDNVVPTAYADNSPQPLCNDGNPYPKGEPVCDEMRTDAQSSAGKVLSFISNTTNFLGGYQIGIAKFINNLINTIIGKLTPDWIGKLIDQLEPDQLKQLTKLIQDWILGHLLVTWVTPDPSGARLFEASAYGADVLGNDTAHLGQGAKVGSAHDIMAAAERADQDRRDEFALLPLKERLFSTDQSQSAVSQLAMAMPSSGGSPLSMTASLLRGFSSMTMHGLASMFSPMSASADIFTKAVPAASDYKPGLKPNPDPFGVEQYYWPTNDSAFTDDPETLYDTQDCKNPDQVKNWGDKATDVDPHTQVAIQNTTNPCLLIRDGVTRNGGMLDSSLISGYGDNDDLAGAATDTGTGPTNSGDVKWPLDDIWWKTDKADFMNAHTLATGTAWGADNMGTTDKGAGIAADIGVPLGTHVYAMVGGKVTSVNLCGGQDNGVAIKSTIDGKTLGISYMHGYKQQVKVGDTVTAGQYIMDANMIGCNATGPHLHVGIAYGGQYICPQDVFTAIAAGQTPDWASLPSKANPGCGGR